MTCEELISAAQEALGGLERLRGIRSYQAELRRVRDDGTASTVSVWRAAGGRVRIEERATGRRTVRVADGRSGTFGDAERAEMVRDARVVPRNMLAHAGEYALALRDRPAPDGSRIVSFPAEFVLYLFRPETFLCARLIDLSRECRIEYGDYRDVDGVATPFAERHVLTNGGRSFEDTYLRVAYNLELPDELFTAGRPSP